MNGVSIRTYKSGKQAIQLQFTFNGLRCREVLRMAPTPTNLKHAEYLIGEIKRKISLGAFNYAEYFPESKRARQLGHVKRTVSEALDAVLSDVDRTYRQSTATTYRKSCHAHWYPLFGGYHMDALTVEDLRQWVRSTELTLKTIRKHLIPLRLAFDRAVEDGVIAVNPARQLQLQTLVPKTRRQSRHTVHPFTSAELDTLLSMDSPRFRNLIQFAVYSGLRTSELMALTWADVDFEQGRVHVCRAHVMGTLQHETKTQAGNRYVDMLPLAREALKRQRQFTRFQRKHVFCRVLNNKPLTHYRQIQRPWRTILRVMGIEHRAQYQTRHTYASHMLSSGVNSLYVAEQMGHKGTSMLDVYAKWVSDWKDEVKQYGYG